MIRANKGIHFKIIAGLVAVLFLLQGFQPLFSQTTKNIEHQIEKAKIELETRHLTHARDRLLRLVQLIENREELVKGKVFMLLGICYEKIGKSGEAKKAYRKALKFLEDKEVAFVEDLVEGLPICHQFFAFQKEETVKTDPGKVIHKEKKPRKKIPPLLIIGAVVVVAVVLALLLPTKGSGDTPPTQTPEFVVGTAGINVPEGGTATFTVRLSRQPTSDMAVSVNRVDGDSDIDVQSGSSLTFTTVNWNQPQTVTLAASEDSDTTNGAATIRVSAGGITSQDVTATEVDNDVLAFVTDTDSLIVPEGRSATFNVRLSNPPASDIQATVSRVSGDTDIYIGSGGTLTFTTSNWSIPRDVVLVASEDSDSTDGQATFRISADGVQAKDITATEEDEDVITAFTVEITSPVNNETITRGVVYTIRAAATSSAGIEKVDFYVDGSNIGSDSSAPFTLDWYTTSYSEGSHVIRVVAHDNAAQTADDQITVTVI